MTLDPETRRHVNWHVAALHEVDAVERDLIVSWRPARQSMITMILKRRLAVTRARERASTCGRCSNGIALTSTGEFIVRSDMDDPPANSTTLMAPARPETVNYTHGSQTRHRHAKEKSSDFPVPTHLLS